MHSRNRLEGGPGWVLVDVRKDDPSIGIQFVQPVVATATTGRRAAASQRHDGDVAAFRHGDDAPRAAPRIAPPKLPPNADAIVDPSAARRAECPVYAGLVPPSPDRVPRERAEFTYPRD